jgi:hypothetical protein
MSMQIPLVIALWEHAGFVGRRRVVVANTPNLVLQGFNDIVSAVGVHPGPDYAAWKAAHGGKEPTVGLYEHVNYGGAVLTLTAGAYANIHRLFNFGDVISSVAINPALPMAAAITPIPLVVEIFEHANFDGRRAAIVEDVPNVPAYLGWEFNDLVTAVRVKPGPNYTPGVKAQLFRDVGFLGGSIQLDPGDFPNIGASHGFNDVVSSIKVR